MPAIRLTGYLEVPPERLAAVRAALPAHIAATRAEPGCLEFEVHQNEKHPTRFDVAELFTNRDSFEAHQRRAQASPWAEVTAGLTRVYQTLEVDI